MSILTSSFAALGAYAPEANPSLAGQKIYTSNTAAALQLMDKQIVRLVGKSITLAAMAYRVRQGRQFVSPPQGMTYSETFLYMMDHLNEPNYKPHPVIAKALDTLFLLHADVGLPRFTLAAGFPSIPNLCHTLVLKDILTPMLLLTARDECFVCRGAPSRLDPRRPVQRRLGRLRRPIRTFTWCKYSLIQQ